MAASLSQHGQFGNRGREHPATCGRVLSARGQRFEIATPLTREAPCGKRLAIPNARPTAAAVEHIKRTTAIVAWCPPRSTERAEYVVIGAHRSSRVRGDGAFSEGEEGTCIGRRDTGLERPELEWALRSRRKEANPESSCGISVAFWSGEEIGMSVLPTCFLNPPLLCRMSPYGIRHVAGCENKLRLRGGYRKRGECGEAKRGGGLNYRSRKTVCRRTSRRLSEGRARPEFFTGGNADIPASARRPTDTTIERITSRQSLVGVSRRRRAPRLSEGGAQEGEGGGDFASIRAIPDYGTDVGA